MVVQGDGSNWPSFSPSRLGRVHVDEREREKEYHHHHWGKKRGELMTFYIHSESSSLAHSFLSLQIPTCLHNPLRFKKSRLHGVLASRWPEPRDSPPSPRPGDPTSRGKYAAVASSYHVRRIEKKERKKTEGEKKKKIVINPGIARSLHDSRVISKIWIN